MEHGKGSRMKPLTRSPWQQSFLEQVDTIIEEVFENTGSADFKDILLSHHRGGKRLRPLVIACCAQFGEKESSNLHLAATAVELLHLASLFHDDVLDDTDSRRFQLAAQKQEGNLTSILSGDYLLTEAIRMMVSHMSSDLALDGLTTIKKMIKSEIYSHKWLYRLEITKKEFLQIIDEKTASLFAFAAHLGIRMTATSAGTIDRVTAFGRNLGMAYQIADDLEDMLGIVDGSDIDLAHGYLSLPIIELLQLANADSKPRVRDIVMNYKPEYAEELIGLMKSYSIFPITFSQIKSYLDQAMSDLHGVKGTGLLHKQDALEYLGSICGYVEKKTEEVITRYEDALSRKSYAIA